MVKLGLVTAEIILIWTNVSGTIVAWTNVPKLTNLVSITVSHYNNDLVNYGNRGTEVNISPQTLIPS